MIEYTSETGASVVINSAPFGDAQALKRAVEKELLKTKNLIGDMDLESVDSMMNLVFQLDSSEDFNKAIFKCLVRCTYNGVPIKEETFEEERAREDYFQIVYKCLECNLRPFLKSLLSAFKAVVVPTEKPQE